MSELSRHIERGACQLPCHFQIPSLVGGVTSMSSTPTLGLFGPCSSTGAHAIAKILALLLRYGVEFEPVLRTLHHLQERVYA